MLRHESDSCTCPQISEIKGISASTMTGPTAPQDSNHQAGAMDRVLNTHELLDIILLQVSPESKANLARVSPVWNDLISKHRHIDPYPNSLGLDYRDQCAGLPHYTSDITFRINPAVEQDYEPDELDDGTELDTAFHDEHGIAVQLSPQLEQDQMVAHQDEFITDPPITVISMNMLYNYMSVTLRVKDGIRIRDFMAVYWAMMKYAPGCDGDERCYGYAVGPAGWFALCRDGKVFEPSPFKGTVVERPGSR